MKTFSDRLKHARTLRRHTQKSLARACGLSQSTVSGYESGSRRSSRSLRKIAQVLRVELDWLDTGKGPMEKREAHSPGAGDAYTLMDPGAAGDKSVPQTSWPFPSVPPMQINALTAADRRELDKWLRLIMDGYLQAYSEGKGRKRRG
ncbi:helix-turn-helix domain-containing protein [Bordetella petrii]|uniref:Transcriptional regulator n=1 Tax=Bordetella petrii (strain ATCC BAA-461 / DSM 12804 / CCUG 43448 / CIP 107267 / Se-1111R) TaxID=340100 RepID=A9IFG5_BORPD|nr:helix-turn-helix transcriptional regulator [Bordetella petrii]CAP45033.1 putative transcriptional regulator [Bordetella petrii]